MALTDAFLSTCRTAINSLTELATYRTARTITTATRAGRMSAWNAAYNDNQAGMSPAYRCRKAIRETVNAQADISGALGPLDRESACKTLMSEYVPDVPRPPSEADEAAAFEEIIRRGNMS